MDDINMNDIYYEPMVLRSGPREKAFSFPGNTGSGKAPDTKVPAVNLGFV